MDFYFVAIVLIVVLIVIRMLIRRRGGPYIEIFQSTTRGVSLPQPLRDKFKEEGIRYRTVFKQPPHQPFIGVSGEPFISLEVHIEDVQQAKRILATANFGGWRPR